MSRKSSAIDVNASERHAIRRGHGRAEAMSRAVGQWVETLETRRLFASVATDKDDYEFGTTAQITGGGFQSGETVRLQVTHVEGTRGSNDDLQNQAWDVTDGGTGDLDGVADGNIQTTWLVVDPDAVGATYLLSATGLTSAALATATFTDSGILNFSVFDLTPALARPSTLKTPLLGFEFQVGTANSNAADNFDKVEVTWTGTSNALQRDVSRLFLYYRQFDSNPAESFDIGQSTTVPLQGGQGKDIPPSSGNVMVLQVDTSAPGFSNKVQLTAGKWYQFYIVADIAGTALNNDVLDFRIPSGKTVFGTASLPSSDSAGNPAGTTVIDAVAPAKPGTPDLIAASDTGTSSTDNITNDNTPTFIGTAEANSTVQVFAGATSLGTTTASAGGSWTFTPASPLANGAHSITAKAIDGVGNTSVASDALNITIDTVAPSVAVNPIPPAAVNQPVTITGTASDALSGLSSVAVTIRRQSDGSVLASGNATINAGTWSFSYTPSEATAQAATATATDVAGNAATSNTQNFTVVALNQTPTASSQTAPTDEDTDVTITLTGDDGDPAATQNLTFKIDVLPTNGTLYQRAGDGSRGAAITSAGTTVSDGQGRVIFAPDLNEHGSTYATFEFTVTDDGTPNLTSSAATVRVNVAAVNDAPINHVPAAQTTDEDTAKVFSTANGNAISISDVDATSAQVTLTATSGTITLNGTSGLTFTSGDGATDATMTFSGSIADINAALNGLSFNPAANVNGTLSLAVTTDDQGNTGSGGAKTDSDAITINVTATNDAPEADAQSVTTDEDAAKTITLGGSDVENESLTFKITSLPAHGGLYVGADITGHLITAGDVAGGGYDIAGNQVTYLPASNYFGPDDFTFKANDGEADSAAATVSITVNSVNDAPAGTDNTVSTNEDTDYTFIAADFGFSDPNDSPANTFASVKITTLPANGTLKLNGVDVASGQFVSAADIASGKLKFTPASNANGPAYASFTFQVQDDGGTENGGVNTDASANTMSIDVASMNDAPAGADNTVTTNEDTDYTFTTGDFGFTDPNDSPPNELAFVKITTLPAAGTLKLNGVAVTAGQSVSAADIAAGRLTFSPAANANGAGYASFTFQVQDDGGTANGGADLDASANTMTIDVTPENDAPVANAQTVTTPEDTDKTITLTGSDGDPEVTQTFAFTIRSLPPHGKLFDGTHEITAAEAAAGYTLSGNQVIYRPNANYKNTAATADTFTFTVTDDATAGGAAQTSTAATVSVEVTSVNDAPVAQADAATTAQDTPVTGNVLTNDSDLHGGAPGENNTPLTAQLVQNVSIGALVLNADGSFTYTPALGHSGTVTFKYRAIDSLGGESADTSVTITVLPATDGSIYLRNDDCIDGQQMLIINGSGANDNIHVAPATGGGVEVFINGASQGTYTFGGRIVVFGYGGDDLIQIAGAVPNIAWIYGDNGNDMLNLGNGGGIAWGGNGSDHINGGSGRDIMIGGEGGDRIVGNSGDDILIAGLTIYDNRFGVAAHEHAWCHINEEWSRTDLATTTYGSDASYTPYEQRIDHLTGAVAGGENGLFYLNNNTVNDDDDYDQIDMLTGSAGEDWFIWTKGEDKVNGMSSTEGAEDLDCIS